MKKDITNIVVDLKDGQRISIEVDNDILEHSAQFDSIEAVCERCSGCPEIQVAVSGLIQAARILDEHGKLDGYMMPTLSVCVERIHEFLREPCGDAYSGGIYIKEDDDGKANLHELYIMVLDGLLEERETTEFTISAFSNYPWDNCQEMTCH